MEAIKDLAVVLRAVPYEDRHKIVTALTENHGKVTVIARNAVNSRRFGAGLENFSAGEWSISVRPGSEMGSVQEITPRRGFEGISSDFQHLALASFFSEVMLRVAPPWEASPELFRLHSNALAALDGPLGSTHLSYLANVYVGKILIWSGCQPQLAACETCGKTLEQALSEVTVSGATEAAGWHCRECSGVSVERELSVSALAEVWQGLAEAMRQIPGRAVASEGHPAVFRWMLRLLAYHVPGFDALSLKSLKFIS